MLLAVVDVMVVVVVVGGGGISFRLYEGIGDWGLCWRLLLLVVLTVVQAGRRRYCHRRRYRHRPYHRRFRGRQNSSRGGSGSENRHSTDIENSEGSRIIPEGKDIYLNFRSERARGQ